MEKKANRKIKSKQSYTFEIIHYEEGESTINRKNEGFSIIELLGICSMITQDLTSLIKDAVVKPTTDVNRKARGAYFIHQPTPKEG